MSETPNLQIAQARDKMKALGVDPKAAEAICSAASVEEINQRIPGLGIAGNATQILMFAMKPLYLSNEHVRAEAERALSPIAKELGLSDGFVTEYLTRMGDYPGIVFDVRYGDKVNREQQKRFREAAEQFVFKVVREYLES